MAFCVNCGQQLGEGAKFCTNCGQTVTAHKTENSERKTVYDGEIHKCPNCGEIIDAFVTNCPACDYEIRGSKATVSLQQFYWDLHRAKNSEENTLILDEEGKISFKNEKYGRFSTYNPPRAEQKGQ